jgi:hypothetical protein
VTSHSVAGGGALNGNVENNKVTVQSGKKVQEGTAQKGSVVGGVSMSGSAVGNQVTLETGATVGRDVIGGGSVKDGNAEGNIVHIHKGIIEGGVWGGAADMLEANSGDALNNKVYIDGVTKISKNIQGGGTFNGKSVGNLVDIAGTLAIDGWVKGGYAYNGDATGNSVNINGSVARISTATPSDLLVVGGHSATKDAVGNTVTVGLQGTVTGYAYIEQASIIGGLASAGGNATNNTVINHGTVSHQIFGGMVRGNGNADNNTVTNTGTTVGNIIGGYAYGNGNADHNTVNFLGGEAGSIYGGWSLYGKADNNTVIISGGTVKGDVDGGISVYGDANNNTVIISNNPSFTNTGIYGGGGAGDTFTGNTLKVHNYSGQSTINEIDGFENFDFQLPSTVKGGDVVVQTKKLTLGTTAGAKSKVTGLAVEGGGQALQTGDKITLIGVTTTAPDTGKFEPRTLPGSQGATLSYNFRTALDAGNNNSIVATVEGSPSAKPEAKSLSEGYISGVALVNQGADLAVDKGIAVAVRNALNPGLQSFGTFGGGSLRYNTGSHVDVDGFSLLAGLGFGAQLSPGRVTLGAFFEYGQGEYNTHNSFASGSVRGSGDTEYIGGGLLGRFDFADTGPGHFYAEATGRMGSVTADYSSSQLTDARGIKASYETESLYYGLHLGTGYIWNINKAASLDVYGKYLWTHQDGDSIRLSTGDPVKFDDVDSHRLRGGGRFAYAINEYISPYIGAAYEHEFDGKAKASTYGFAIDAPDMTGGTGIGEIGLTVKTGSVVSLDIGAQGYTGTREGVTGTLQLKIEF